MTKQFLITVHTRTYGSDLFITPYWDFQFSLHIVWRADLMAVWIVLIRKQCYKCIAPLNLRHGSVSGKPYGYRNYSAVWIFYKRIPILNQRQCPCPCPCPCSMSLSMSVFYVLVHVLVHVLFHVLVLVLVRAHVRVNIKYGTMNIYVLHGNYIVDSQKSYEVAQKLKGPHAWEWMGNICWKSRRLSIYERYIEWYH